MEEPQPNLNDQESRSRGLSGVWLWLALAICAYVFSIGPVTGLYERTGPHSLAVKQTYRLVYAPVVGVLYSTPLKSALLWWIKLWVDAFNPKMNLAQGEQHSEGKGYEEAPSRLSVHSFTFLFGSGQQRLFTSEIPLSSTSNLRYSCCNG